MVELLSVWFLDEPDVHYIVLSADLFPGGQGCYSDSQRCLSTSDDPGSAFFCHWLGNSR